MDAYQFNQTELSLIESCSIPMAVYQFINKRVVTRALSAGFLKLFGYERDEGYRLMDYDMYCDTHPDDVARIADAAYRFALGEGPYDVIYRTKSSEGDGYTIIHALGEHAYTEDGTRLAWVQYTDEGPYQPDGISFETPFNHILNSALHEESFSRANYYDGLTGMPTMGYFFELAEASRKQMLEHKEGFALMFFDLTGMKSFNSDYGFAQGNHLIKEAARMLVRHFGNESCCHLLGDHFAAYAETAGIEERLEVILDECAELNGGNSLPMRVGICIDREGHVDISTLCDRAKMACDSSRDGYFSQYHFFDDIMQARDDHRHYVLQNFDRALAEGWIEVHYQPIVRASNGRVCDEEALARWIDPERGMLSPAQFIPVLEEAKLIYRLDLYMLDQILLKMKRFENEGLYRVPNSLNLSRNDFDSCDMVEEIRKRVDAAGVGHDKITIEITESVVAKDLAFMGEQVRRFRELGFQVWMDDFGSGYSSLDVLQIIQFDLIKFDMAFMQRLSESDKSKIILTELIRMAIGLGVETICEGVERQDQVDFLREVGCSKLQGFFFTPPLSIEAVIDRYKTGIQIGFENPLETDYYTSVSSVNLYDLSVIAHDDRDSLKRYFDTIPMAIIEINDDVMNVLRCNTSYRQFMDLVFPNRLVEDSLVLPDPSDDGAGFFEAMRQCAADGKRIFIDEDLDEEQTLHAAVTMIARNPTTGATALAVAVLALIQKVEQRSLVTYAHIARALATDYEYLFYVDLDTEEYVEYSSDAGSSNMSQENKGNEFFATSRTNALTLLYPADQEAFCAVFTKENIIRTMDAQGTFTYRYRMMIDGKPHLMNMKAVRLDEGDSHIIIGVNSVDAMRRRQERLERLQTEQNAYGRLSALVGGYVGIYVVDPESGRYLCFGSSDDFAALNLTNQGEEFFVDAINEAPLALHAADLERFCAAFTKDNVLHDIANKGSFEITYHLLLSGEPTLVRCKAVLVQESEGERLIIGVSKVS